MPNLSQNSQKPIDQFAYCGFELSKMVNCKWYRWFTIWFSPTSYTVISYRLDRFGYLIFKKSWAAIRLFFFPVSILFRLLGVHHEIHYSADIGKGLLLLHESLGVVVSGKAIVGDNLVLTGGNCIGGRKSLKTGDLVLGNNVSLGVNASILGPVTIGNNVNIGAGAVVITNAPDNCTLVGVPARVVKEN